MTIRKNFLFDDEVAKHLEELAKVEGKTQTQIAQEAVEIQYKKNKYSKKIRSSRSYSRFIFRIDR